jgi:hypothetical protein
MAVVTERYRSVDALSAATGWHRKHAVRALRRHKPIGASAGEAPQ